MIAIMKKRFQNLLLCLFVLVPFQVFGFSGTDVTMVSYEQSWLDDEGTLSIKNNTNEEIRNIHFVISYLDMSDNQMDYEEFFEEIQIAPGMTKKLDIEAYEHDRDYHYYKSEGRSDGTAFKVNFELKGYNLNEDELEDDGNGYSFMMPDSNMSALLVIIAIFIFGLGITVGLYVLVAVMAQKRHRNVAVWILLSILATPLLMAIILLVLGDNSEYQQLDKQ